MKKERVWIFLLKISTLTSPCRRGILTRPQVGYFQVAIGACDMDLHTLHALRVGLCAKVSRGDLTVEEATDTPACIRKSGLKIMI